MKRALIVTAHPDDECMFFAPTILSLQASGIRVGLLCLSNGNADRKGQLRQDELRRSCRLLGIDDVEVLDHA